MATRSAPSRVLQRWRAVRRHDEPTVPDVTSLLRKVSMSRESISRSVDTWFTDTRPGRTVATLVIIAVVWVGGRTVNYFNTWNA